MATENLNELISKYAIRIGDTSLVLGQRLGEWCGHGPILEEDIAMTNISLDLIGQTRAFYTYAAEKENKGRTEDDLAFFRGEREFQNVLLAEQTNGDFAKTMLRQLFISCYQFYFFEQLSKSKDETFAALGQKSLKEVTYHLRHSTEWIYRLAGGTEESRQRLMNALEDLWIFTGDLFMTDQVDATLTKEGIAVDMEKVKSMWHTKIKAIFTEAAISMPDDQVMVTGGIQGRHTEHLGHMLSEMQILPRSMPGATW